jgi:hypothetical protein
MRDELKSRGDTLRKCYSAKRLSSTVIILVSVIKLNRRICQYILPANQSQPAWKTLYLQSLEPFPCQLRWIIY